MNVRPQDRRFLILNIFLTICVIGLALGLVFVRTHAQEQVKQSVAVQNSPPTVDTVIQSAEPSGAAADLFFLTTGKTTPLYVWGHVSDPNGCQDIHSVSVRVYRKDVGMSCGQTDGLCEILQNVPIEGCSAGFGSATYIAAVDLPYFTDPTDAGSPSEGMHWIARVTAIDNEGATGSASSGDFDIASIVGMDADDHVDFGTLSLGAITPPIPLHIMNYGNRSFDFDVASYGNFSCNGSGSIAIPSENLHVSMAPDATFEESTPLPVPMQNTDFVSTNPNGNFNPATADVLNANSYFQFIQQPVFLPTNVQTRLTTSGVSRVFFLLNIPTSGISGQCSGSLGITAVPR